MPFARSAKVTAVEKTLGDVYTKDFGWPGYVSLGCKEAPPPANVILAGRNPGTKTVP